MPVNGSLIVSLMVVEPGLAPIVEHMCSPICPVILWTITWSWVSSDGARSSGVRSGRGPPMIVWITCRADTTRMLGKYFPPRTVRRETWHTVLRHIRHCDRRRAIASAWSLVGAPVSHLQRPSASCVPTGNGY